MNDKRNATATAFTPEQWDETTRFCKWWYCPQNQRNIMLARGLETIASHRSRLSVLAGLLHRMQSGVIRDSNELKDKHGTRGDGFKEYAALAEVIVSSLYSHLDGIKDSFFGVYEGMNGVQKKTVEKFFRRAAEDVYPPSIPEEIVEAISAAYSTWYQKLRRLRVELTHGEVGSIYMRDGKIEYWHSRLRMGSEPYIIRDMTAQLNEWYQGVTKLLNTICGVWLSKLDPRETVAMCGISISSGLFLARVITVPNDVTNDSGLCLFRHLYEEDPKIACPLRDNCSAYERVGDSSRDVVQRMVAAGELSE